MSKLEILLWFHSDSFTECRDTAILRPPPICHFRRPNATLWEIQLENWTNPLPPVVRNEVANRRLSHVFLGIVHPTDFQVSWGTWLCGATPPSGMVLFYVSALFRISDFIDIVLWFNVSEFERSSQWLSEDFQALKPCSDATWLKRWLRLRSWSRKRWGMALPKRRYRCSIRMMMMMMI